MAQQLLNAVLIGSIYALFAVGYSLVFGVLDVLNLAHSAVFMLGAVFAYSLVVLHAVPLWAAAPIAVGGAGAMGLVIEFVALRPLRRRNAPAIANLIATIGLALIFVAMIEQAKPDGVLGWLWQEGPNSVRFPARAVPNPTYLVAGLTLEGTKVTILAVTLVLMTVLGYVMRFTQLGRALRAVAENPRAARLLGVDVDRLFALTLVISSAMAGLAGLLFGIAISDISPYMGRDQIELRGLSAMVLGGMGSVTGAVLGGYLLGLFEVVAFLIFGSNVQAGIAFLALFLVLILRPQGLLGAKLKDRI
jgi:branched-chain amino acid transport system permease protein